MRCGVSALALAFFATLTWRSCADLSNILIARHSLGRDHDASPVYLRYELGPRACLYSGHSPAFVAVEAEEEDESEAYLSDWGFPLWCSRPLVNPSPISPRSNLDGDFKAVHSMAGLLWIPWSDLLAPLQILGAHAVVDLEDALGEISWKCSLAENGISAEGEEGERGVRCWPRLPEVEGGVVRQLTSVHVPMVAAGLGSSLQFSPTPKLQSLPALPEQEMSALYDLYQSTRGDHWQWRENVSVAGTPWNFSGEHHPCEEKWQGIVCSCIASNTTDYYAGGLYFAYDDYAGGDETSACYVVKIALVDMGLFGSIPSSIGDFARLTHLHLSQNDLSGTLPTEIGQLTNLRLLSLAHNEYLHGSLPEEVSTLSELYFLELDNTGLGGRLPQGLASLSKLQYLYMHHSHWRGAFLDDINAWTELKVLDFRANCFTGTLPASIGNLSNLIYAGFDDSKFVGTLPDSLANMKELVFLRLQGNLISGTFPPALYSLTKLVVLNVSGNMMQGTISPAITNMTGLTRIHLRQNRFSGSFPDVFESGLVRLAILELNDNRFTGDIPKSAFSLSSLRIMSMSVNCLSVTLTDDLCLAPRLVVLALDGVNNAPSCVNEMPLGQTYMLKNRVSSTIPSCLFNMTSLSVLHLAANLIEYKLPADLNTSSTLQDLVLSHNLLYGEIPPSLQTRRWRRFDLSHNRLIGSLHPDFAAYSADDFLLLSSNRLSGKIPAQLLSTPNIQVLNGNLFECDYYRSDQKLPEHDPSTETYVCANTLIQLCYVWAVPVGFSLIWFSLLYVAQFSVFQSPRFVLLNRLHSMYSALCGWMELFRNSSIKQNSHLHVFMQFNRIMRWSSARMTFMCIVVLAPAYIAISRRFRTYQESYVWVISSLYNRGEVPAVVVTVLIVAYSIFCDQYFHRKTKAFLRTLKREMIFKRGDKQRFLHGLAMFAVMSINFFFSTGAHVAYAVIANSQGTMAIMLAQLALSLFKIVWQDWVLFRLVLSLKRALLRCGNVVSDELDFHLDRNDLIFLACMVILNAVFAPLVAVLLTSMDCFSAFVSPMDHVTTFARYNECPYFSDRASTSCMESESRLIFASIRPPFYYSYQCMASYITNFSVIYTYMFLMLAVWLPLGKIAAAWVGNRLRQSARPNAFLLWLVTLCTPRMLRPLSPELVAENKRFFNKDRFTLRLLTCLVVLVTFGVAFPPLAVVVCATVFSITFFEENCIGRLLENAQEYADVLADGTSMLEAVQGKLEADCIGLAESMRGAWWVISPVACLFHAFIVLDTQSDQVEGSMAIVFPLLLLLSPIIYQIVVRVIIVPLLLIIGPSIGVEKEYLHRASKVYVSPSRAFTTSSQVSTAIPVTEVVEGKELFSDCDENDRVEEYPVGECEEDKRVVMDVREKPAASDAPRPSKIKRYSMLDGEVPVLITDMSQSSIDPV